MEIENFCFSSYLKIKIIVKVYYKNEVTFKISLVHIAHKIRISI